MIEMWKNNKYGKTAIWLYVAYFLHGIQAIILSQNAEFFADKWGTTVAGVLGVIAWTGIGKIAFLTFSGPLADKIGRKPVVIAGMIGYCVLFGMLMVNTNIIIAYALSFIGGAATSLYDGSINPALLEIFPNHKSIATILNKGAISISGTIFPLLLAYLATNNMSVNISIMIPFVISVIMLIFTIFARFPDDDLKKEKGVSAEEAVKILEETQSEESTSVQKVNEPNKIDKVILVLFAFFIYSTFYLFQQVMTLYATDVVGMTEIASRAVASYYQIGSFVAVVFSAVIMSRGVRDMAVLVVYPLFAALAAGLIYLNPTETTLSIGAAVIGFAAAGGSLQLGNSLLNQFFDTGKGKNTSLYYFIMSLGSYLMPTIASYLIPRDFTAVMLLDAVCALIAFLLMLAAAYRYRHIFGVSPFSLDKKDS